MKLNEFRGKVEQATDAFVREWLKAHRENPGTYPLELGESEWWNQFSAYLNSDEDQEDEG